eukprot:178529_1
MLSNFPATTPTSFSSNSNLCGAKPSHIFEINQLSDKYDFVSTNYCISSIFQSNFRLKIQSINLATTTKKKIDGWMEKIYVPYNVRDCDRILNHACTDLFIL